MSPVGNTITNDVITTGKDFVCQQFLYFHELDDTIIFCHFDMTLILHEGYGYSKRTCENVISWYLNHYYPNYDVTIHVLHRGLKREHVWGYCDVVDAKSKNPREFLIEMQTYLDTEDYVRVLLHELAHVSQWIDGKLTYEFMMIFEPDEEGKAEGQEESATVIYIQQNEKGNFEIVNVLEAG